MSIYNILVYVSSLLTMVQQKIIREHMIEHDAEIQGSETPIPILYFTYTGAISR